jgi:hypothetical protein
MKNLFISFLFSIILFSCCSDEVYYYNVTYSINTPNQKTITTIETEGGNVKIKKLNDMWVIYLLDSCDCKEILIAKSPYRIGIISIVNTNRLKNNKQSNNSETISTRRTLD